MFQEPIVEIWSRTEQVRLKLYRIPRGIGTLLKSGNIERSIVWILLYISQQSCDPRTIRHIRNKTWAKTCFVWLIYICCHSLFFNHLKAYCTTFIFLANSFFIFHFSVFLIIYPAQYIQWCFKTPVIYFLKALYF